MKKILLLIAVLFSTANLYAQQSHTDTVMGFTISMPDGWEMKVDKNRDSDSIRSLSFTKGQENELIIISSNRNLQPVDSLINVMKEGFQQYINGYKQQGIKTSYTEDSIAINNIPFFTIYLKLGADTDHPLQIETYYLWDTKRLLLCTIRYNDNVADRDIMYKAFVDAMQTLK